jgi:biotin carboxylase
MSAIIFISGSKSTYPFLKRAKEKKFQTIVFDRDEKAFCRKYCDEFYAISSHDNDSILEKITKNHKNIAGCLCYSSYPGALKTTSRLCKEYKLSRFSIQAVDLCYNKILMKHILTNAGIRCPKDYLIKPHEQESTDQVLEKVEFSCVVKPSDGIGSLNVRKIDCREELNRYLYECTGDFNDLVLEEYIDGFFLHVDGFVQKKKPVIISYSEKFVEFRNGSPLTKGYRLVEDINTVVNNQQLLQIESQIHQGLATLGIDNHFFGADVIVSKSGDIYFLEMGFLMDAKMDRLLHHAGLDIYGYLVDIVTGKQITTKNIPVPQKGYALRFLYAGNDGILLKKGTGDTDILTEWEKEDGDLVSRPQSVADIVGWLIASGSNSHEAWRKCIADTDRCYFSTTKTVRGETI